MKGNGAQGSKCQAFPFRRHQQRIDRGNSVLFLGIIEDRGFIFRSPCTTDVRNEQEARLIDEDQMGPKSFGLFYMGSPVNLPMDNLFLVPL